MVIGDRVCSCFLGATGKSAQLPLYLWLPDAMEGPTPVSALIHAATMVTAGVYMVARSHALFAPAPDGDAAWSPGRASSRRSSRRRSALVQNDIKRVLAYSTVSQLGYMFLAWASAPTPRAIFHLMTHAFFKALLFLGAGSVMHALAGELDMRKMGGLREEAAHHRLDDARRLAGDLRHPAVRRLLQQGRDPRKPRTCTSRRSAGWV